MVNSCSHKQETFCIIYCASHTKYDGYGGANQGGRSSCVSEGTGRSAALLTSHAVYVVPG